MTATNLHNSIKPMTTFRQPNFFILTGAPGGGKTTLINKLRALACRCVDEPARKILAEQRATNGSGLPEKDKQLFAELLLSHSIESFENSSGFMDPVIFDRSVVDSIGYAALFGLETERFEKAARQYLYNNTVFVLAPWEDIYTTDEERKMTFEQTIDFHDLIISAYERFNYKLVEVPFDTVESRAQFILERIGAE